MGAVYERLQGVSTRRTFLKALPFLVFGSAEFLAGCSRQTPEELYKSLLTTPIKEADVPPGFAVRGISAGNLDATAQAFKTVGQVNILVAENNPMFGGMPNGGISYTIFPSSKEAKGAYQVLAQRPNSSALKDLGDTAVLVNEVTFFGTFPIAVALVDNTVVATMLAGIGTTPQQPRIISLAKAGVEHLKKVKR